jgi:hypothetical protein
MKKFKICFLHHQRITSNEHFSSKSASIPVNTNKFHHQTNICFISNTTSNSFHQKEWKQKQQKKNKGQWLQIGSSR